MIRWSLSSDARASAKAVSAIPPPPAPRSASTLARIADASVMHQRDALASSAGSNPSARSSASSSRPASTSTDRRLVAATWARATRPDASQTPPLPRNRLLPRPALRTTSERSRGWTSSRRRRHPCLRRSVVREPAQCRQGRRYHRDHTGRGLCIRAPVPGRVARLCRQPHARSARRSPPEISSPPVDTCEPARASTSPDRGTSSRRA